MSDEVNIGEFLVDSAEELDRVQRLRELRDQAQKGRDLRDLRGPERAFGAALSEDAQRTRTPGVTESAFGSALSEDAQRSRAPAHSDVELAFASALSEDAQRPTVQEELPKGDPVLAREQGEVFKEMEQRRLAALASALQRQRDHKILETRDLLNDPSLTDPTGELKGRDDTEVLRFLRGDFDQLPPGR